MLTGWRYRVVGAGGVVAIVVAAVLVANHPFSQSVFTTYIPVFNRLDPVLLKGRGLATAIGLAVVSIGGSLLPLFRPRPRRVLDTIFLTHKRVLVGGFALATLGYYNWSYRIPRATLTMMVAILFIVLPVWFAWIRHGTGSETGRALIVGDDLGQIQRIAPDVDGPIIGYLCPTIVSGHDRSDSDPIAAVADGGAVIGDIDGLGRIRSLTRLGGLSRLEDALVEYDIDTVVLAFGRADRAEFFGALEACFEHGVDAKVHRDYADSVLVSEGEVGDLVDVDLDPLDPIDQMIKRGFDVIFAGVGLVVLAPFMAIAAVAIKLDSPGPVLYGQKRTTGLGNTFCVYKFRTMIPEGESVTPTEDEENDRITRVGRVLRKTHFDEFPQLWSILVGEMSVVGPRAVWTDEESLLEREADAWRKRWFVKPGLTGLAQINGAKSTDPKAKLRYDLEYIRQQSFWFDIKIVIRQIWKVVVDVGQLLTGRREELDQVGQERRS